jgi:CheY-like chemotaxis protein
MTLPVRILVMEDEEQSIEDIEKACAKASSEVALDVARSADEALAFIDGGDYDLMVCDLGVPQHSSGLHGRTEAGLAVFERIQNTCSGVPVVVFSGRADERIVGRFLQVGRQADLSGAGPRPLVQFFPKEDLPAFTAALGTLISEAVEAAGVDVDSPAGLTLSVSERRVLQNICVRLGASRISLKAFGSGLSDSKTLHAILWRPNRSRLGQLVVKLGTRERTVAEADRALHVAPNLPVGVVAPLLHVVDAGAGRRGGAFYQVAEDHERPLFEVLSGSADEAAALVGILREKFRPAFAGAAPRELRLKEIRRPCISDLELRELGSAAPDVSHLADMRITVNECTQHADMHGFNVLANRALQPAIIDFADVRVAPASVDPITLELSAVFHPEGPAATGVWPSEDEIRAWHELDHYADSSPFPAFVRACREWTEEAAAGSQEIDAVVLSYCLRQLKYGNPTGGLARALAEVAADRLAR